MSNSIQLSANGNGPWIRLATGENVVYTYSDDYGETLVAFEMAVDESGEGAHALYKDGVALVHADASERQHVVAGDGLNAVRAVVSSYDGSAVTMLVRPVPQRL